MCSVCRQHPCHPCCPNAPEPKKVYACSNCNEDICFGDEYAEIDGEKYCKSCINDMTAKEIVELFGGDWRTADESNIDDRSDYAYEMHRDDVMERMYDN